MKAEIRSAGSTSIHCIHIGNHIHKSISAMSVINESGESLALFSLWSTRKIVLIFTRHMGCRFCKEQVFELKKIQPNLLRQGISVEIITVGKYEDIPRFKTENGFDGEVYVDSSLFLPECYKTMKLANGLQYLLVHDDSKASENGKVEPQILPETLKAAARVEAKGGFQDGGFGSPDTEFTGDTLQIGGIFVLGPGNICDYSYRCAFVGDLVDLGRVVTAATGKNEHGDEIFYTRTLDWNAKLNIHSLVEALPASPRPPKGDSRGLVHPQVALATRMRRNLFVGLAVIALVVAVVVQSHRVRKLDVDREVLLLAVGGAVAVLIAGVFVQDLRRWIQPASSTVSASPIAMKTASPRANNTNQDISPAMHPAKASSMPVEGSGPKIGGCTLYKLSAIDKLVLSAAGKVDCDCAFLEDVDMINMTDRAECPVSHSPSTTATTTLDGTAVDAACPVNHSLSLSVVPTDITNLSSDHTHHTHSESTLSSAALVAAQSTLCYVREFLAKPNPNLGRAGPTCPFVPKSLQLDSIYLCVVTGSEVRRAADLDTILLNAIPTFKELEPKTGPKASFKAIILIFPDLKLSEIPEMIDGTQKRLKPNFVEEGLMLGEFHLHNNAPGLHNSHFYPLRTPYPCMAIRHMVPSDVVFLNPAEFPAAVRLKMLNTFVSKFGDMASNDAQTEVARKLLKELQANNAQ